MPSERPSPPGTPPDWRRLRLWHIQPVRDLLVIALLVGVLYAGYVLRPLTIPMLLAMLLAYLFEPLVKRITRSGRVGRKGAAGIILAAFFLLVLVPLGLGLVIGIGQTAALVRNVGTNAATLVEAVTNEDAAKREEKAGELPKSWKALYDELGSYRGYLVERKKAEDEIKRRQKEAEHGGPSAEPTRPDASTPTTPGVPDGKAQNGKAAPALTAFQQQLYGTIFTGVQWVRANADTLAKSLGEQMLITGQGAVSTAFGLVEAFARLAFGAVLTAFFFFFFSTGWGKVLEFWAGFIPERRKGKAIELITKMDRVIAGFVRGRLTICAIEACYFTIAYWFIGVPMPLVVGPLVGLLFLVPFLHILSVPVGILLLWLQPSGVEWQTNWWWIVFAPLVTDFIGQFSDDWFLSPKIQGKNTGMDVPTIVFASMAGGALAGLYGLLVAIPVAACLKIFMSEVFWPRFRRWARGEQTDFLPIATSEEMNAGPRE